MLDVLSNLSTLQLVALVGAVGYVVWEFVLTPDQQASLLGMFGKVTGGGCSKVASTVSSAVSSRPDVPTRVEVVEDWERLMTTLEKAGLHDARRDLNELWKLLNEQELNKGNK